MPWAEEQAITEPAQLDNRVLDRFSVRLLDHGGKRGPLSEHSIWTYVKAVNRFLRLPSDSVPTPLQAASKFCYSLLDASK